MVENKNLAIANRSRVICINTNHMLLAISEIFSVKEWPDPEIWVWGQK